MSFSYSSYKKLLVYLIYTFIISLYLPFIFSNIITIFLVILSIYYLLLGKHDIPSSKLFFFSAFILLFFIYIISLIYTENLKAGSFILEKRLSFIAFPIIFLPITFDKQTLERFIKLYVLVSFLVTLLMLMLAVFKGVNNPDVGFTLPTNHQLSSLVGFHATYLGMYLGLAFLFCAFFLLREKRHKKETVKYFLFFLTFLVAETLLFARIVLVALSIISGILIVFYVVKTRRYIFVLLVLGFAFVASLITLSIPNLKERFKEAINYNSEYTIDKQWGGRSMRLLKWDCSLQIIKENLLLGVSPGDSQDVLDKCYKENKFSPLYHWPNRRFNAHNQYLQELIGTGLFGFLSFIWLIIVQAYLAIRKKFYLHILFLGLFSIVCVTESTLGLNKGIVFFTFFSCLFSSYYFNVTYHET